jgi:hypothetical protein
MVRVIKPAAVGEAQEGQDGQLVVLLPVYIATSLVYLDLYTRNKIRNGRANNRRVTTTDRATALPLDPAAGVPG